MIMYLVVWALCTFVLYYCLYTLLNGQPSRVTPLLGQLSGFGAGWCIAEMTKTNTQYWWLLGLSLAPGLWLAYKEYRKYKALRGK